MVFKKEPTPKGPKIITGLERDSITIAQTPPLTGVFPDSQPEFYNVVFNNHIFEGLARIVNGKVKPSLAVSWTNPDQNTWRFKLREGVKFHNGDPFTASDVKFSIDTSIKEDWPNSFNLATVDSVEVIDESTIEVKTKVPDPVLLNRLVYAFIVSEKQYKSKGKSEAAGTGPYKLVSLNKDHAKLEVNQDYYLGTPKVREVVFKFFPDDTEDEKLVEALKKGEVDLINIVDQSLIGSLANSYQVKDLTSPFISFLWMDTTRNKSPYVDKVPNPLRNKLVRQAIYKTININKVVEAGRRSSSPASQFVTDAIFGYNPNISRPEPNIEAAKKLLEQAGVKEGFKFTLDAPVFSKEVADQIAKDLAQIGIKVEVKIVVVSEAFPKWFDKKDFSAFIISYAAETFDAGEIFVNVLHTPKGSFGSDNLTDYSNPEIDKLAEEIASEFRTKERLSKLQNAMAKVMDEVPAIPLYGDKSFYVFDNDIDWTPTAFGAVYANEITGRQVVNQ